MVLKNKRERDRVKTSGLANKKKKLAYKGKSKDNYKKSSVKTKECCICYSNILAIHDNSITCGKIIHFVCVICKSQMKGQDCPMCRSHSLKKPVSKNIILNIHKKVKKPKSDFVITIQNTSMSPKQSRSFHRSGPYVEPFGPNTNRLVRQRKNSVGHTYYRDLSSKHSGIDQNNPIAWLTQAQVLDYNGSLITYYDTDTDNDLESDSESYISLSDSTASNVTLILDDEFVAFPE